MDKRSQTRMPLFILTFLLIAAAVMVWFRFNSIHRQTHNFYCRPTFADGDGPYYEANAPERIKITPATASGELLVVTGTVTENDCITPVANAILDVWQANEYGFYDRQWYRGRVRTDHKGNYTFETVMPKGYGEGTAYRPPHIHFKVWQGNTLRITSEMFLPAARAQAINEAYILNLEAKTKAGRQQYQGTHHIVLP